jgi:hypothetical protein
MMTKMKSAGILARTVGVLAAIAIAATPLVASAQHGGGGGGGGHGGGGGGGGHGGGGGGAHMGGGGGAHMGGGGGAHMGGGGHVGGGAHFAGGGNFAGGHAFGGGAHGFNGSHAQFAAGGGHFNGGHEGRGGREGWGGHDGRGGHEGREGWGHGFVHGDGRFWGGGFWGGRFWPGVRYGEGFAWFLPILPIGYATYYWGGLPYYYYDNAYYTWDAGYNGYVATDPPPVDANGSSEGSGNNVESNAGDSGAAASGGASDLYVYPRNGQSDEQTSTDRFECHKWAVSQTGFDPTRSTNAQGGVDAYRRAVAACLDARGYSAK